MIDIAIWLRSTHREARPAGGGRSALLRRRYDAALEEVWSACTDPERLRRWFADVTGNFHEGGDLAVDVGMPKKVICRILRCDRPRHLAVTWSYGGGPRDRVDQVELRLSADGDGTWLELEHRSEDGTAWLGVGPGWEDWLFRLSVLLDGGDPAEVSSEEIESQLGERWAALR